jgi:hypothetical protein
MPIELSSPALIRSRVVDYASISAHHPRLAQKAQLPDGCNTKPCSLSASMHATNPPSPTAHVPFLPAVLSVRAAQNGGVEPVQGGLRTCMARGVAVVRCAHVYDVDSWVIVVLGTAKPVGPISRQIPDLLNGVGDP